MENPIAIVLLRKADEIITAKVTYMTVDTPLSIYVFHRLRTIFLSTICPSAVILINGRSMYPKPYKTPFTATDMTNKVTNNSMPNNRKEIYLETRILPLLAGRMSSSLIVPDENSPATLSPTIMMVKMVITIIRLAETFTPSHIVPSVERIFCSK